MQGNEQQTDGRRQTERREASLAEQNPQPARQESHEGNAKHGHGRKATFDQQLQILIVSVVEINATDTVQRFDRCISRNEATQAAPPRKILSYQWSRQLPEAQSIIVANPIESGKGPLDNTREAKQINFERRDRDRGRD